MRLLVVAALAALPLAFVPSSARAQYFGPAPAGVPAEVASGAGVVLNDLPGAPLTLRPTPYASFMLPESPTHPWVILTRSYAQNYGAGLSYGHRYSPYGDYSRWAYFRTGPSPALRRPYVSYEVDHWNKGSH
jgi:hypothetical protein